MSRIIAPLVHLNGTSRSNLVAQYQTARDAVARARECLHDASPNQRDYYCHPLTGAWKSASDQHAARLQRLLDIEAELLTILDEIES